MARIALALSLIAAVALLLLGGFARDDAPAHSAAPGTPPGRAERPARPVPQEEAPSAEPETPVRGEPTAAAPAARSTRVEVRVLEFDEPVSGLGMTFTGPGPARRETTDPRGVVAVDLSEGEWRVEIPARGLVTAVTAGVLPSASVELRVPGLAVLAGTVTDAESHAPIAGASVEVFPPDAAGENPAFERMAWTRTDASGRFRLAGLPDRPVRLSIERRSHERFEEVRTPGPEGLDVRLRPLGGFRIRVVDAAGRPAALWPVEIEIRAPGGAVESYEVFLDEVATLYVSDLAAGMYRFRARIDGSWTRESSAFASPQEDLPIELTIDHALEPRDDIPIPPGPEDRFDPDDPHPQHHPHRHGAGEHH